MKRVTLYDKANVAVPRILKVVYRETMCPDGPWNEYLCRMGYESGYRAAQRAARKTRNTRSKK